MTQKPPPVRRVARIRAGVVALGVGASVAVGAGLGLAQAVASPAGETSAPDDPGSSSSDQGLPGIALGSGSSGASHAQSSGS